MDSRLKIAGMTERVGSWAPQAGVFAILSGPVSKHALSSVEGNAILALRPLSYWPLQCAADKAFASCHEPADRRFTFSFRRLRANTAAMPEAHPPDASTSLLIAEVRHVSKSFQVESKRVTGLITAAGGAWNASIVSEYLRYKGRTLVAPGLGSLITEATAAADFPLLAAGVLTMALALVLLNRVLWKRLYRMADTRFSLNR